MSARIFGDAVQPAVVRSLYRQLLREVGRAEPRELVAFTLKEEVRLNFRELRNDKSRADQRRLMAIGEHVLEQLKQGVIPQPRNPMEYSSW